MQTGEGLYARWARDCAVELHRELAKMTQQLLFVLGLPGSTSACAGSIDLLGSSPSLSS